MEFYNLISQIYLFKLQANSIQVIETN